MLATKAGRAFRAKSIVSIKEEQARRVSALRKAAKDAGMLASFVRLVDYMTVESLVGNAICECENFIEELDPPGGLPGVGSACDLSRVIETPPGGMRAVSHRLDTAGRHL